MSQILKWNDIDKTKFFGYGTSVYSLLTLALHPITVLKTRQQILNNSNNNNNTLSKKNGTLLRQNSLRATYRDIISHSGFRGLFRGGGVVVALAVPARVVYISVLEVSRHETYQLIDAILQNTLHDYQRRIHTLKPAIASIAGGIAGGLAAVSAQIIVVPMDIISQKQIVMSPQQFNTTGSATQIATSIIRHEGWTTGLFKGFTISIFSSLPTGTIWWATYGGCQHFVHSLIHNHHRNDRRPVIFLHNLIIQFTSGVTAAFVAATLSMPLDVVKTRLQVGGGAAGADATPKVSSSAVSVAKDLWKSSGPRGFFRGLGPRIMHMSVWGTLLSSFYELLRNISRKEGCSN